MEEREREREREGERNRSRMTWQRFALPSSSLELNINFPNVRNSSAEGWGEGMVTVWRGSELKKAIRQEPSGWMCSLILKKEGEGDKKGKKERKRERGWGREKERETPQLTHRIPPHPCHHTQPPKGATDYQE